MYRKVQVLVVAAQVAKDDAGRSSCADRHLDFAAAIRGEAVLSRSTSPHVDQLMVHQEETEKGFLLTGKISFMCRPLPPKKTTLVSLIREGAMSLLVLQCVSNRNCA
jgi:hypothetical protein